jgi:hypothetical protein
MWVERHALQRAWHIRVFLLALLNIVTVGMSADHAR